MRKYGGAIISGNIIQWKRGIYLASYKVARKAGPRRQEEDRYNGPPAWQRSPQSLCYVILYTCFLLSLSLSPHFEATSFSHPTKCTPRGAHLLRAADSFLFLIREPGPQKERDEARAGRRQWRGQSNSSAGRVRKIKLGRGDDGRFADLRYGITIQLSRLERSDSKVDMKISILCTLARYWTRKFVIFGRKEDWNISWPIRV